MVPNIQFYPTTHRLVDAAIATQKVNNAVTKITVWLRSRIELLPTSVDFIETNNLLPEIISKSGMEEDLSFSTKTEESYTVDDGRHLYQLMLLVASSS